MLLDLRLSSGITWTRREATTPQAWGQRTKQEVWTVRGQKERSREGLSASQGGYGDGCRHAASEGLTWTKLEIHSRLRVETTGLTWEWWKIKREANKWKQIDLRHGSFYLQRKDPESWSVGWHGEQSGDRERKWSPESAESEVNVKAHRVQWQRAWGGRQRGPMDFQSAICMDGTGWEEVVLSSCV